MIRAPPARSRAARDPGRRAPGASAWELRECRAPSVDRGRPRARDDGRLGPGRSAAPGEQRLSLLPSGPDEVHASPLRGTRSSTSTIAGALENADLGREFGPAGADCRYRAPLAPHLARPVDHTSRVGPAIRASVQWLALSDSYSATRAQRLALSDSYSATRANRLAPAGFGAPWRGGGRGRAHRRSPPSGAGRRVAAAAPRSRRRVRRRRTRPGDRGRRSRR